MAKEVLIRINKYVVIESLRKGESKTGKNLYDDIISRLTTVSGLTACFCEVTSAVRDVSAAHPEPQIERI